MLPIIVGRVVDFCFTRDGRVWKNCTPLFHLPQSSAASRLIPRPLSHQGSKPWSSAALAGLNDHVGELLHFWGATHVVQDGEGLQVLRNTAGRGRRLRVQRVVEAQQLQKKGTERTVRNCFLTKNLKDGLHSFLTELWVVSALRR